MRRFLIVIICCFLLTGTVFAAGRADEIRSTTMVYTDGSADVVLTVNFTLSEVQEGLTFPLPADVEEVQLNDQPVETIPSRDNDSVVLVELGSICANAGRYSLTFRYCLPAVVRYEGDKDQENRPLVLELPLLSGFEYPVDTMDFTITFPEGADVDPTFESGYLLQSIESDLTYTIEDGVLSGSVTKPMKDKETLRLTTFVNGEGFPELVIVEEEENMYLYIMGGVAAFALLFWLIFLRSLPVVPLRTNAAPAGIHAGEVASRLNMEGADLTMMIFQWAQLGYIRIVPDKRERVWLHKRMEMGNERSPFEVKVFQQLFGRNQMVEGTGSRFARLWHQVDSTVDNAEQITPGGTGARIVFRAIAVLASTIAGAAMGQKMIEESGYWQLALMLGLAIVGSLMAWRIQAGMACLHRRRRDALPGGILCAVLWLIAAAICRCPIAGATSVGIQLLAGIFSAWGGRRTFSGWQTACQLQGLRHYLTGAKRHEIKKELEMNPDYFFEMAPYALAFGVENGFAKRFGRNIMPQCSYLDAGRSEKRNAREWAYLMRQTAEKLDNGAKRIRQYRKRR